MKIKPMDLLGDFLKISAAFTIIGGFIYSTGWVVSRSQAGEIAQQTVYQEALDRERADLQFQIDMATMKLKLLSEKADRSDFDNMEAAMLKDQIGRLQERIVKLDTPQP